MNVTRFWICASLTLLLSAEHAVAQSDGEKLASADVVSESLLQDLNGDGVVRAIAFGDSLTRGVGDFTGPGVVDELFQPGNREAGYPLRLEQWFGVSVDNYGNPGEEITEGGLERFARTIPALHPDVVFISEGANDALRRFPTGLYFHYLQAMVNIAKLNGAQPVVGTINPTCCGHVNTGPIIHSYNDSIRRLALFNSIPLFDTDRAFRNSCELPTCALLNKPDGLHPNTAGYDVMGEAVSASLLDLDLFSPEGPSELETKLGLAPGTVRTRPDPVTVQTE